ncbi:MAG: hypothetical protein OEM67_06685, partial [Thermoleophilia bacterium]|nr:hypothetical protein [Thermoleophilia bacterium]
MSEPAYSLSSHARRRAKRRREGRRRLAFLVASLVMLASVAFAIAVDDPANEASSSRPAAQAALDGAVIVAHHGAAGDAGAGLLGGALPEVTADLQARVEHFGEGDSGRVVPAIHLTVVRSLDDPGPDGLYRQRETRARIQMFLDAARSIEAQLILDVRPGRARWIDELRWLKPFLAQPDVGVSLDPEWKTGPDGVPGRQIGQIGASTVNQLSRFVGDLVVENELPDKPMVIHQFAPGMVTNREGIVRRAGVILFIDING